MSRIRCCLALFPLILATATTAQVPSTVPFQARLVTGAGAPIDAGTVVQFSIFDAATAGTLLWGPESHTVTPVNGIVSVYLGDGDTPDPIDESVFVSGERFLEVVVGAETLAPRFRMTATAYAFRAESVVSGAITANSLANNSVNSSKVADNTLTANDLATNSVAAAEIAAGAVGTSEVADNSLTASDLAPNSVNGSEIASAAVGSDEVKDNTLTANDLATNSVGAAEIAASAVGTSEVANNTLTKDDLAAGSVTASELATNAVTSNDILNETIRDFDILDEPGAAHSDESVNVVLPRGVDTNIHSESINIPTAGLVLAIGTASIDFLHNPILDDSEVFVSVSTTSASTNFSNANRHLVALTAAPGTYRAEITAVDVFSFTSAGTKTIFVVGESEDGFNNTALDASLTLVFIPSTYGTLSSSQPQGDELDVDDRSSR